MTSSEQTHDISGSVEKSPLARVSLFELGKRKKMWIKHKIKLPPRVCPPGNLANNPVSESLSSQFCSYCQGRWHVRHSCAVLYFEILYCNYWKLLCSEQWPDELYGVFQKYMSSVFTPRRTLTYQAKCSWLQRAHNSSNTSLNFPLYMLSLQKAPFKRRIKKPYRILCHQPCWYRSSSLHKCFSVGHMGVSYRAHPIQTIKIMTRSQTHRLALFISKPLL